MAAPVSGPAQPAGVDREQVNILVVDDLPEKHVVFRTILDELDQNVVSARSGLEALRFILEMEFAVILLDVNMPDIDGLETAGLIRQYRKSAQTPIVFITAYVDDVQSARGYALGAVDYIPSPVVPEVLRSKVRVFVELFRMHRQLKQQAAEREALARSEAARAAAEAATHRADFLADASQALTRSLDLDPTVRAVFEVTVPALGERAVLALAGAEGDITRLDSWPASTVPVSPQLRDGLRVAMEGRRFELRLQDGQATAICPLLAGDRVLGALLLIGPQGHDDPARMALVREIVSRASIAIENARLYQAVQQADRRKNEFLAMLAHELRNPLAPIRNAVHVMQGDDVAPSTLSWARDVIGRQTDHMSRLIDDLLDVSRIVQGKVVVQPERLLLSRLLERAVEATAPRVAALDQILSVEPPQPDLVLQGDLVRLSQVLSNLINNASKFSGRGSLILLKASWEDGKARISVRDQGAGIAPAFLPHIFELFAQGDQTLDRSQGGLGIGLTLVKHLVELHGGQVCASSAGQDQGTEVTIWLPAQPVQPAPARPGPVSAPRPKAAPAKSPPRVLVVDDLAASAETLMMLLEMEGFEVRIAHDGPTALQLAVEFEPEVVLLDIGLPGMNGFEVAERLRQLPCCGDSLLIALTGYGEAQARSRSAAAGFDFHMVKPADINLLLSLLADPARARGTLAGMQ